ncbi:hypothetical protein RRG08_014059 [Elysia crispata]|uniref:Uncharacterized protein n=1 Tax=Elysia crispata TaxID=231223 RepID=A0AAE1A026_9GAST|nr:hypothetical protein RRG08_014059 [Elysia crispata]
MTRILSTIFPFTDEHQQSIAATVLKKRQADELWHELNPSRIRHEVIIAKRPLQVLCTRVPVLYADFNVSEVVSGGKSLERIRVLNLLSSALLSLLQNFSLASITKADSMSTLMSVKSWHIVTPASIRVPGFHVETKSPKYQL